MPPRVGKPGASAAGMRPSNPQGWVHSYPTCSGALFLKPNSWRSGLLQRLQSHFDSHTLFVMDRMDELVAQARR